MPKSYKVDSTTYQFPDEMSDDAVHDVLVKQGVIKPPEGQHWAETMGVTNPVAKGALDLAEGAASGAASTVFHGGDLIRRGLGMERIIDKPDVKQAMSTPDSTAGKVGRFGEQAAEFLIPGGIATKAGKAAQLGIAGRAALEGLTAAGVTATQTGGDPTATAVGGLTGAAGPIVGAALPAVGRALSESAQKTYGQVLGATTKANKFLSRQVTTRLIDEGVIAGTMKGLQSKTQQNLTTVGQAIGDAWDALPADSKIGVAPAIQSLEKGIGEHEVMTPLGELIPKSAAGKQAIEHIKGLQQVLTDVAETNPATGELEVPVSKLRELRQYYDKVAAKAGRYEGKSLADASSQEAHGMAADAIREELGKQFPDIAAMNKEYSFWKNVNKVVTDTIERRTGQASPLGAKMTGAAAAAAGFGAGGVHGAILGKALGSAIEDLATSPAWRTMDAVTRDRLAKAIAAGDKSAIVFYVSKIAKATGGAAASNIIGPQNQ